VSERTSVLPGCTILQRGVALQLTVAAPVPVLLEFSGEALVALLMAAQAAFRERPRLLAGKWRVG